MSEQRKTIASYRRRDAKHYGGVLYGADEPEKAVDAGWFMRDLWVRADTLQDAGRPVVVWVDDEFIHIGTMLPINPPEPAPRKPRGK